MRNNLVLAALLSVALSQVAMAAETPVESCNQIRAKIGVLPLADPDLLRQLAARTDCGFTSSEFYAVAYGGQMPVYRETPRRRMWEGEHHHRHEHHYD